ncbi:hypothetical protein [Roseibium algae]|uniref:DKNYY family protein n=1 Tax=Roseibium algae TaxID=3123038 RepID=A0ABU8TRR2_9HYPH
MLKQSKLHIIPSRLGLQKISFFRQRWLYLFGSLILISSCNSNDFVHLGFFHTNGDLYAYSLAKKDLHAEIFVADQNNKIIKKFSSPDYTYTYGYFSNEKFYYIVAGKPPSKSSLYSCDLGFKKCSRVFSISRGISNPIVLEDGTIFFQKSENCGGDKFYYFKSSFLEPKVFIDECFFGLGMSVLYDGKIYFSGRSADEKIRTDKLEEKLEYAKYIDLSTGDVIKIDGNGKIESLRSYHIVIEDDKLKIYYKADLVGGSFNYHTCVETFENTYCDNSIESTYPAVFDGAVYFATLNRLEMSLDLQKIILENENGER